MIKSPITVNNVPLETFIEDKENIVEVIETVERDKLVAEYMPEVNTYKKPVVHHKQYIEKNGKVKILNQLDINLTQFDKEIEVQIRSKNVRNCAIMILFCRKEKGYLDNAEISKRITNIAKKFDVKISKNLTSAVRWHMSVVADSELAQHVNFVRSGVSYKYLAKEESQKVLRINDLFDLVERRLPRKKQSKNKSYKQNLIEIMDQRVQNMEKKEKQPSPKKEDIKTIIEQPMQDQVLLAVQNALGALKGTESIIKFAGDLNINIYLGKEK